MEQLKGAPVGRRNHINQLLVDHTVQHRGREREKWYTLYNKQKVPQMERDLQLARSKAQYIYRDLMESLTISYRYESTTVGCLALLACELHPSRGKQRNLFFYKKTKRILRRERNDIDDLLRRENGGEAAILNWREDSVASVPQLYCIRKESQMELTH